MVDYGLFVSFAITSTAVWLAGRLVAPVSVGERTPLDQFVAPLFAGVVVGRATTLALSDVAGLFSLREFLTVRGGVAFWPAVLAAVGVLVVLFSRPEDPPQVERVAGLAPYAIVALAAFQATCVVRDGCPGPTSGFGLVPSGLTTRQFPVGIMGGIALLAFAYWLKRSTLPSHTKILIAVVGVGIERALVGEIGPSLASARARDGIMMSLAFAATICWWAWFNRQEQQWRAPALRNSDGLTPTDGTTPK